MKINYLLQYYSSLICHNNGLVDFQLNNKQLFDQYKKP